MKRKEKKAMLLKLHQEVKLLPKQVTCDMPEPSGFCGLITNYLDDDLDTFNIIYKYKSHIPERFTAYWFKPGDWKIRLSFLEEVMKVELNPYYKLAYKLGLYKFKY